MTTPIEHLASRLSERFPSAAITVDAPHDSAGPWFLDFADGDYSLGVQWRSGRALGVSAGRAEFGAGAHELFDDVEGAAARVIELVLARGGTRPPTAVRLSELRRGRGLTQTELADRLHVKQAAVSRLENRDDVRLSSLTAAVAAMGGELQLRVKFPGEASLRLSPLGGSDTDGSR